jgi:hypothetical protein
MPGDPGGPVASTPVLSTLHRGRVQLAPGVPCALFRAKDQMHSSGASRREREVVCGIDVVVERKRPRLRHSGAMRSIEPGISRFRVWSCGPSRNDGYGFTRCLKIESALARAEHPRSPPRPACGESIGRLRRPFLIKTPKRSFGYGVAPGEGDPPRVRACRYAPSPRPSPRKRGEGAVRGDDTPRDLSLNPPAQCPAQEWLRGARGGRGWRASEIRRRRRAIGGSVRSRSRRCRAWCARARWPEWR